MNPMILTAILPALTDILKKGADRLISGRKVSVQEEIELMKADAEKLKALAELDRADDGISRWVANFRASFRYVFCALILLVTTVAIFAGVKEEFVMYLLDLLSGVTFFLIGHRTYQFILKK